MQCQSFKIKKIKAPYCKVKLKKSETLFDLHGSNHYSSYNINEVTVKLKSDFRKKMSSQKSKQQASKLRMNFLENAIWGIQQKNDNLTWLKSAFS